MSVIASAVIIHEGTSVKYHIGIIRVSPYFLLLILEKGANSVQGEKCVFLNCMNYMQIATYNLLIPNQWVIALFVLLSQIFQ